MPKELEITMEKATELDSQYRNIAAERQRKFEEGKKQQANAERDQMMSSVLSLRTAGALG